MANPRKKNFAIGWSLVFHSLITYWIFGGLTTSGLNVIVPAFIKTYKWNLGQLMTFSTVGGLIAVIGAIFFAQWVMKQGPRIVTVASFILGGINIILFGRVSSIAGYALAMIGIHLLGQGYSNVTTNTLIGNWFPKKKGVILGITTAGLPLASVAFVPLLYLLVGKYGIKQGLFAIGAGMVIIGVISWFWIKNTPEEVGLAPDNANISQEEILSLRQEQLNYTTQWTMGKIMRHKTAVLIGFVFGMLLLVNQGFISQLVPYLQEIGYRSSEGVKILSMAAALGIIGNVVWGVLDHKISTKRTAIIFAVWHILGFALLLIRGGNVLALIGVGIIAFALGGNENLMASMIMNVYGRYEFASVNRLINSLVTVVRALAFVTMGIGYELAHSYHGSLILLLAISAIALLLIIPIEDRRIEYGYGAMTQSSNL